MPPSARHRPVPPVAVLAALAMLAVAACGGAGAPVLSFDPTVPCPAEGQQPGAYPALEAALPAEYEGRPPDSRDSGRLCTAEALGALAGAGVDAVRFAGATWETGGTSGLTQAVFEGDGLDPAILLEFYAVPAQQARRTKTFQRSETTVGDVPAKRLDVLGTDGTGQTIVTWRVPGESLVRALLAADLGDTRVAELLETLGAE